MDVCVRVVSQSVLPMHLNSCDLCNTQLNFIFCILTRLLNKLRFVPLTGVQRHCLHDLFGVGTLTGNQTTKPPTTQTYQQSCSQTTGEQLRSQARLIDILTYCTFPEKGLPCGKITQGFDPTGVKQIVAETWWRQIIAVSVSNRPKIRSAKVRLFGLLHRKTQNSTKLDMKCLSIYSAHLFLLVMCGNG